MTKTIKIGDKSFVMEGDTFMEEEAYNKYKKQMKTVFKLGGSISEFRGPSPEVKKHGQRD
jgi:hypothetical protein|tara:strand:- start:480 stop:659 length:180 start_codon:yes stop_codon:yes gene_type:complete